MLTFGQPSKMIVLQKGDCEIKFVKTKNQLADLFTKPLARDRFNKLRTELGILDIKNVV